MSHFLKWVRRAIYIVISLIVLIILIFASLMFFDEWKVKQKANLYKESLQVSSSFTEFINKHRKFTLLKISDQRSIICTEIQRWSGDQYQIGENITSNWSEVLSQIEETLRKSECRKVSLLFFRRDASQGLWRGSMGLEVDQQGRVTNQPTFNIYR